MWLPLARNVGGDGQPRGYQLAGVGLVPPNALPDKLVTLRHFCGYALLDVQP